MPRKSPLSERLLTLLLVVPLFVPLPLTLLLSSASHHAGLLASLSQTILDGTPPFVLPAPRGPVRSSILDTNYQQAIASAFNDNFAGRSWLIRVAGEVYLRLFHSNPASIVIGRHDSLFYNYPPYDFVNEYCVERGTPNALLPIVENLRRWRDNCLSRGVGFALVITPSKPAIYPEDLPWAWRRHYDPRPRAYDQFVALLKAAKVPYVDGHMLTLDAKRDAPAPVFPDCGAHWNEYASLVTADAILGEWQRQGQPVQPIRNARTLVTNIPTGQDADMLHIFKRLFAPEKYRVSTTTFPSFDLDESRQPNLVMIGGSFLDTLGQQLFFSHEFSEIHLLYYYNLRKEVASQSGWRVFGENIAKMDVEHEIFPARCLLLEVNEQQLLAPVHLQTFFHDTMDRLPVPGTPSLRFPYSTHLPYQWGETLLMARDPIAENPFAFSGFSGVTGDGRWTDEPHAVVRLTIPDATEDKLLQVDAAALIPPGGTGAQHVTVFANDARIAEWVFDSSKPQQKEATIPHAALTSGELILSFQLAEAERAVQGNVPPAPTQKPALFFRRITVR